MRAGHLRTLFFGLVATVGACGGGVEEDSIRASDFTTDVCKTDLLEGVTPSAPVDYLELSSVVLGGHPQDPPKRLARRGTKCLTATDKARCETAMASLDLPKSERADIVSFVKHYLVYTRGDEVGAIQTSDELRGFLAPFENVKDAALLLRAFSAQSLHCYVPNTRSRGDSFEFYTSTGDTCGGDVLDNVVRVRPDGVMEVVASEIAEKGDPTCRFGRRPEGYTPTPTRAASIGEYLAVAAELEAASVPAFRRLARELRAHGAPAALVSRAELAARDEVRHARATKRLAERFGGTVTRPMVGKLPVRSLAEIAEENAREGCVGETFGALLATVQAARATDPEVRREMEIIARDETEHAALAWDAAEWFERLLDDDARARVRQARTSAVAELAASLDGGFSSAVLGLPSPAEMRSLLARLEPALVTLAA
ncbi:putative lipoprotein [Labilithrix luteola]|uniref:Putative lipoprotein n=1 Tax=Labilithrix luteola TaxID=1391654 RepID=A0A0K1Q037_9BACT|nr:putative lipoprotein [Labilithrix luteola]